MQDLWSHPALPVWKGKGVLRRGLRTETELGNRAVGYLEQETSKAAAFVPSTRWDVNWQKCNAGDNASQLNPKTWVARFISEKSKQKQNDKSVIVFVSKTKQISKLERDKVDKNKSGLQTGQECLNISDSKIIFTGFHVKQACNSATYNWLPM